MKKIVALFGKTSSGKSICSQYVEKKYNYTIIEIGNFVRESFSNNSHEKGTVVDFANWHYSQGTLQNFIQNAIRYSKSCKGNILFSGVRLKEEYLCLKREYPDTVLVRIDCPTSIRKQRYYKESSDEISFEDRNKVEESWIKDNWNLIDFDFVISNENSIEVFYDQIDNVFSLIEKGEYDES